MNVLQRECLPPICVIEVFYQLSDTFPKKHKRFPVPPLKTRACIPLLNVELAFLSVKIDVKPHLLQIGTWIDSIKSVAVPSVDDHPEPPNTCNICWRKIGEE
jgi:hypothetical protein